MELLGQVANSGGGVLAHDVHVVRERGKGLEEGGGFHLCKWVAIPDLENGFRGGWTGNKSSKGREPSVSDLRYLLCVYRAFRSAFTASMLGSARCPKSSKHQKKIGGAGMEGRQARTCVLLPSVRVAEWGSGA